MATPVSQMPYRVKGQTTCVHHQGRKLEFYCEKCEELVCPKCLSSVHKGHIVCELSEITPQKEVAIKDFLERTEKNELVQVRKYIASTDILLEENTTAFQKLSQKLKLQAEKLKKQLDLLTEQTLSVYRQLEEDNTKLITKYKQDLQTYEKQLKQQVQECKAALQRGSHIQIYDTFCEIHSPSYSLPVKPVLDTADFTPNANPQDHLKDALGKVFTSGQGHTLTDKDPSFSSFDGQGQSSSQQQRSATEGEKQVKAYKLMLQTKVVEQWRPPCRLGSVCPTIDGQVWTKTGSMLTLLNRNGKVTKKVNHYTRIKDISLSPTTHKLWVCLNNNNISELVSGQLIQRFGIKEEPRCICITASNHVIIGMVNNVSKFTTDGEMVCTTFATVNRKPLVCTPHRISECPVTQNVAVADINDKTDGGDENGCVVVMDTDFNKLFVYRGDITSTYKPTPKTGGEPFDPYGGVVYDSVGNLIIGDYHNCRVLLISGGGEFLRVLHTDTDWTWRIGIDREDVLWAGFGLFGMNVKLLQYSNV